MSYTPRGWLKSSTDTAGVVSLTTHYSHTGWSDNRGNSQALTLDPMGNAIHRTASLRYNGLDDVTEAQDFKDVGTETRTHDALGLPLRIHDSLGRVSAITRDAFGRLTARTQTLSSAIANHSLSTTVGYSYVTSGAGAGQLSAIVYPSGSVLTHHHDATGQLRSLYWDGHALLSDITYNALGQPLSWNWTFADANPATALPATRSYNTAGQLISTEFSGYAYNARGQLQRITQRLARRTDTGSWTFEAVPFNAGYDGAGQLLSLTANGSVPAFQYGQTYNYDASGNRSRGGLTQDGNSISYTSGLTPSDNRLSHFADVAVSTNAAGDTTSLLGKTLAYDAAGRLAQVTHIPACPTGQGCASTETTLNRFNGQGQRYLRDNASTQHVYAYGSAGHDVLGEYQRQLGSSALGATEHIWLPTASGPMPVAAVIDGVHYAVHADHLNTPRRLTDSAKAVKWQWPYSGFGEIAPQSTPAAGQAPLNYSLRYPGQIDDGNGLFYNWHRFYDPRVGRYTQADPIGLDGGRNRFGYVDANPLGFSDPLGLEKGPASPSIGGPGNSRGPDICTGRNCSSPPFDPSPDDPAPAPNLPKSPRQPNTQCHPFIEWCFGGCTCSDTSTNGAACLSCCTNVTGWLRSGTGSVCQQQCIDKFPGLLGGSK